MGIGGGNDNPLPKQAERRYASFTEIKRRQIEIIRVRLWLL